MTKHPAIAASIQNNFPQQVKFLQELVQVKSVNPFTAETSAPNVPIEKDVAERVYKELQRLNFSAAFVGVSPQRPNVISSHTGRGDTPKTLILTTHMDTVEPPEYTRDPWGAQIEDGRLYGVGAADAKAQITAFIYAMHALREANLPLVGNVILAFVVDEEAGACSPYGTQYLLLRGLLHGDAAIVGEPGDTKVAIAHRGLYRFRLHIYGESAHTGHKAWEQGRRGRNAILDMARLTQALADSTLPMTCSLAFPQRRSVLTFPTLIHGGTGINIVPGSCTAYGDVRLLPGLSADAVKSLIQERLAELSIKQYRLEDLLVIPAAETEAQAEIVQTLASSVEKITGARPKLEGIGPACDGWMFITRGIPTVCGYGVNCGGVHSADEWIDLESLRKVTEVYAHTILSYCGLRKIA